MIKQIEHSKNEENLILTRTWGSTIPREDLSVTKVYIENNPLSSVREKKFTSLYNESGVNCVSINVLGNIEFLSRALCKKKKKRMKLKIDTKMTEICMWMIGLVHDHL